MEYKTKDAGYEAISPGTMGVAQKISSGYNATELGEETSKLVFLVKNNIMTCGRNQY